MFGNGYVISSQIARFMGATWGPPGDDRTQVGPTLAPWTLLSGITHFTGHMITYSCCERGAGLLRMPRTVLILSMLLILVVDDHRGRSASWVTAPTLANGHQTLKACNPPDAEGVLRGYQATYRGSVAEMLRSLHSIDSLPKFTPYMLVLRSSDRNGYMHIVCHDHDSKVHGANMGPIWGRQDPGGPLVGPINFAIWRHLYAKSNDAYPDKIWLHICHVVLQLKFFSKRRK